MNATIKDVARAAKVSIATVSRILNNQPGYSLKTKQRVLKAIKTLNYQPNAVARGLINKKTRTLGILVPNVSSMFSSLLLKGVEDAAYTRGYSVIMCHTANSGVRTMDYLHVLKEKRVDGLLFTSEVLKDAYYDEIRRMGVPLVLLATQSLNDSIPYVKVDDRMAAYHAVRYLIAKGHTKIGMISGNKEDRIAGQPRIDGFIQALKDHNLSFNQKQIVYGPSFSFDDGKRLLLDLLSKNRGLTAIFAASDFLAVGALSAAYSSGLRVPDDLSIIGYDNLEIAKMSLPPLTTVGQPLFQIGSVGGMMLIDIIEDKGNVEGRILPHQIIERQTVSERSKALTEKNYDKQ
ncbi:LacI family DNA-binding transcriptional regulator [Sporolactobacillus terrae]|uniref:LacI family transcriptional regulator n=1 Tax=Sporolactobacillus terrae TaxID=269673 RepID=A0ABX5Q573_9BACL|nr:substrate-binding domain-containing protein [Sporolactobacillus terrae]QAA21791.1 LacI family transcriptional regulator [Sporolactobacillus terrae]QAA24764.1 LacI family transcriptional regulator [Sporolactobacillus terrae]UAK16590.1 substrate-binding domain-containing protein [Sporolactobacillus terrae]